MSQPDPVDIHVGAMLRHFRAQARISQSELGSRMDGLSFQQIQKYERGANRISASRLHQAALALKVQPADFFEGLDRRGDLSAAQTCRDIMKAANLVPGVARLGELTDVERAAIQTMIVALLPPSPNPS